MVNSPISKASYSLARAFGWTPGQVQEMTMAQVDLYLEMLGQEEKGSD